VTTSAVWSSSSQATATVSNAVGTQGLVTAVATGSSTLTATLSGVSGTTKITVSAPTVTQIVVSPIASSVRVGQTVRYTATAILSNNTQRDVTQAASWASSDTQVAAFAQGAGGGMGGSRSVNALAVGMSTISASYQNITGSTSLTVTNAVLTEIQVTPIQATLTVKASRQFTATAIYSDDTQQDVTAQATWVSSNTGVAQVSTAGGGPGPGGGGARGTVTAIAAGNATISATVNGITGSTTVMVTAATLSSISLTPIEPSVAMGTQVSFVATAVYSDDSTVNVTNQATFTSSDPKVAAVSTANGSRG